MQNRVPLHKRSASRVLADEAHRRSLEQEGPQRDELTKAPVNRAIARHVTALVQQGLEFGVGRETRGLVGVGIANQGDNGRVDSGGLGFPGHRVSLLRERPVDTRNGTIVLRDDGDGTCLGGVGLLERFLEPVLEVLLSGIEFFRGEVSTTHQRLGVEGSNTPLCLDEVVHQRLGHRGVISLVVPAAAVADDVDDDICFESLTVGEGHFCDPKHSLGVIAVHVENWCLDSFGDIGGIDRGASVWRKSGESNLVVDDHVYGSPGAVGAQLGHLQRL